MADEGRTEFEAALTAARENPEDTVAWDQVEDLAAELDSPDEVAALFREVLNRDLSPELADEIGERAAGFFEEWFGDDPGHLAEVLTRVLQLNPSADWAFQRLTLALTGAQRWDQLLAVYDRIIESTEDLGRQVELLEEASQVARDMADDADKAIAYLQRLLPLKPEDDKLAPALERLLEKHERWTDLISLWRTLLEGMPQDDRVATLGRIAACYLDNLGDTASALEAARDYLGEADSDGEPMALLERILRHEHSTPEVREGALDVLRYRYESDGRPGEVVRVLESVIEVAPDREKSYRSEAAQILAGLGELEPAMNHYSALLALDPSSAATLGHLRQLAQRSGNYELFAQGVSRAAEAAGDASRRVALLSAAAKARLDELQDKDGAIALFKTALDTGDIGAADVLAVGRKLNELLATTDRNQERLDVLEKLAHAETVESNRKALMGDIARLSDSLGDADKALSAWRARLEIDAGDQVALDGTISLLEREQKWDELVTALGRRTGSGAPPEQRRSDLVRIARIYLDKLEALDQALAAWQKVQEEFGETSETVTALTQLYSRTEKWEELAALLERACSRQSADLLDRLALLGDAYRDHLGSPPRALDCYDRILRVDPQHAGAGAGLQGLLNDPECSAKAVEILSTTYRATGNWQGILDLAPARFEQATETTVKLGILREAASIQETQAGDRQAALASLARAFPMAPRDIVLERDMARLARATGTWEPAVEAYRQALEAVEDDPNATGELSARLAEILDADVGDKAEALSRYQVVADLEPQNHPAATAVVRLASELRRWPDAARALVRYARARDNVDGSHLELVERHADDHGDWADLVSALESAVEADSALPANHAADLLHRIAGWKESRTGDSAGREATLVKVLTREPRRLQALVELAALRREHPGPELYETLRTIAEIDSADLDVRWEAAEVAAEHVSDQEEVERALSSLMGRASAAWRGSAPAQSKREPREAVEWTLGELGRRYAESDRANAAFELFVDAARLPFPAETQRSLRIEAATVASEKLGDASSAIEMYRSILAQAPGDSEALQRLGELYRVEDRFAELLSLCQHELGLGADPQRKLELRLEVARLVGEVERRAGRVEVLRQNLREMPGHQPSITALTEILEQQGRYDDLAGVLAEQAETLESGDDPAGAAALWKQAAHAAESELDDARRAIDHHRRVVALVPDAASFDALARLYTERDEPDQAVTWLERLLALSGDSERQELTLRLARAHIDAGDTESAISTLTGARSQGDSSAEIRDLLIELYRRAERWEPLADLLMAASGEVEGSASARFAADAAELYHRRLEMPRKALPAIDRAMTVDDSRELQIMKAQALRGADRQEEARELLTGLIESFGRRRSKERAAIHLELALVLQSEDNHDRALKEIELASKMDAGNPQLLRRVAGLALASGKPDKAEKSLQSLLLVVRRKPPGDDPDAVGESEVLYELHRIAAEREDDKTDELLESALEAAVQSDAEVGRLQRTLVAYGEYDTALRALEARLEIAEAPQSKAELLTQIATVLEDHKDRQADGLSRRLDALSLAPQRLDLHDRAIAAAREAGMVRDYVERIAAAAGEMKRDEDAELAAQLWMRLGELAERDLEKLEQARDFYRKAEEAGADRVTALFSLARVSNALGDGDTATQALDELTEMADAQEASPQQARALYRLAEMQVGSGELRARGISMLRRALEVDSKPKIAARILQLAADAEPESADILALYERVARASGEWEILLDFLERRAQQPDATPEQIREAVELANAHGEQQRGEALLERAVTAARSSAEGLAGATWAAIALCQQRLRDNARAARDLFYEISGIASPEEVFALGDEIARVALGRAPAQERGDTDAGDEGEGDGEHRAETEPTAEPDLPLAAEILEILRQHNPSRREVWEPLADVYRRLGERDRFMEVISSTLPSLMDPRERNTLRKQTARYLIDAGSPDEARDPLRDALLDDPDDLEAADMLESVLRGLGDNEGLADFLSSRFDEARERGNPDTMADVALRLGKLLDEMESPDAVAVYQTALQVAPENPQLLERAMDALPVESLRERAELGERLLAVVDPERVGDLALQLAALYEQIDDPDGVLRALRIGQRRAPTDGELRQRLETHYREEGKWRDLADMMVIEAQALEDDRISVARFREAATLHRDNLMDADAAAGVLRMARERAPSDASLAIELAQCLQTAGNTADAADALATALEGQIEGQARVDLLLTRAGLLSSLGRFPDATTCLEEAYLLDRGRSEEALWTGLDHQRQAAQQSGDRDSERAATLRLADLYAEAGHHEYASDMLISWVVAEPQDSEALIQLRDLDTANQRWAGVVASCARLVMVQHGEEQIDAAHRLADAARAMGDLAQARQGLEFVHQVQPENGTIREHLKGLYDDIGALRELADLLLAEAEHAGDDDARYEAYRRAADIQVNQLGDAEAAIGPAQKAQQLRPDDHPTLVLFADVLTASGRSGEAAAMLEPAIAAHKRRSPELAALQHRMARVAQVAGDHQTQLAWLKKAFDVDRKNGFIAAELAQLATELQDYDLALKPLRAISLMDTPGPISRTMALLWEAKIEHARGNRAKAELWAKKALREDPEFMEAQEFLSQIQE